MGYCREKERQILEENVNMCDVLIASIQYSVSELKDSPQPTQGRISGGRVGNLIYLIRF